MIKIISLIDRLYVDEINLFLLENEIQECIITHDVDADEYFLVGYFEDKNSGDIAFNEIKAKFSNIGDVQYEKIVETDWVNEYKKYCQPWSYQRLNWVPLWLKDEYPSTEFDTTVYIDSGLAFGTGMHETTRLCAKALVMFTMMYREDLSWCVKKCIDVGCGSGILGISAIKLGIQSSVFIDNDENAITACKENVLNNNIDLAIVEYVHSDLKFGLLGRQGDLVLANILADVLIEHADILASSVKPGGMLCLSGILIGEMEAVREAFQGSFKKFGVSAIETNAKLGEWGVLMFLRG